MWKRWTTISEGQVCTKAVGVALVATTLAMTLFGGGLILATM